jgi:serine/threonine-protein kinase RsbW
MTARPMEPELELEFPPKAEYVGVARHTVAAMARMRGISGEMVEDVKLAVSEACTNAVTAQAKLGASDRIRVTARGDTDGLLIEVEDGATDALPSQEEGDDGFDSEDFSFETNLSLPLLRGLVDDLEIAPREGGGRVVRMRLPIQTGEPA